MQSRLLFFFPAVFLFAIAYSVSASAQENDTQLQQAGEVGSPSLNTTGSDTGVPIIEQNSTNGTYLVQLRWPQVPLNPDGTFEFQLFFLNASSPRDVNQTVALSYTNQSNSASINQTGSTVPVVVENILPIASYDIAIYSADGKLLWEKTKQPGEGGMPGQRVLLEGNYTGPVSIKVTNILPGWKTEKPNELNDSVTFAATVVPEFPMFGVATIGTGIAAAILALRFGWRRTGKNSVTTDY
jgi:hypothetical protein